ncbi:MAG: hypothetical protein RIR56_868 [Bacteroidota bacterium]|jgi:transcriptional regulator with XRE-family HTH domain
MSIKSNDFDFGENLAILISKKYKSVAAFSKATGINVKTLEGWCGKNSRFPSRAEYIKKMADALDVSVHELMFGEPDNRESIATIFEKSEIHTGMYEITIKKVIKKE